MTTSRKQTFVVASLLTGMTISILGLVTSFSFVDAYANSPIRILYAVTSVPTESLQQPTITSTPDPMQALDFRVSWDTPVKPPETVFTITIETHDAEASSGDWVLGDITGNIAEGQLRRDEYETVTIDVDWSQRPLLNSPWWFYIFGQGNAGSTFAQVFAVNLSQPVPAGITLTPTASCGYARFDMTTEADMNLAFPDETFKIGLANEGIFTCGTLDWYLVENTLQPDLLSCSPVNGVLEGSQFGNEATAANIQCAINWEKIDSEQTGDLFLVLFSAPRVNGADSAHLIRIRITPSKHD